MLQEELTDDLRRLATELDELGAEDIRGTGFRASAVEQTLVPPEIPDFQIVSLLGSGGMGAVYVARQVSLGRDVAIKVVSVGRAHARPEEARTVAQLHHPNIVQVFSAGGDATAAWFAMELVKGESADRHVFSSIEEVVRLGIAVAEALAYAHRCGILHRDVKPSNIFIGEDGRVKLGDFGLACLVSDGVMDKSGTKRYMAPEVLNGGEVSEASDQYSLGVTLRELVGRVGDNASHFSPDFAAICAKATADEPSHRYESVEAMLADLRRFLAHEPIAANPPSPLRRFRLFARRNPLAAFGIAAAALLMVAFVAALAVGYVRTTRALAEAERARAETEKALAETERARAQTEQALAETHQEAAKAAQSLASVLTDIDRDEDDRRDAELERAEKVVEELAQRFPEDPVIKEAAESLRLARERHSQFKWIMRRRRTRLRNQQLRPEIRNHPGR